MKETNKKMEELTEMPSTINRKREVQITKKLLVIIGSFFVLNLTIMLLFLAATQTKNGGFHRHILVYPLVPVVLVVYQNDCSS